MDNRTFKSFKKRALHSVSVNEKFKNGSFKFDKMIMNELFDDSKLDEEECNHDDNCEDDSQFISKVRIGKDYQVTVLPEPNEPNKKSYTLNLAFITIFFCTLIFTNIFTNNSRFLNIFYFNLLRNSSNVFVFSTPF